MNLKTVRLFHNTQRQSSRKKMSPSLQNLTQENEFTNYLAANESYNTGTNDFLAMFESEVKKHWGI